MDVVSCVMCHLSEFISMTSDWSVSNYEPKSVEPRHVDSSSSGRLPVGQVVSHQIFCFSICGYHMASRIVLALDGIGIDKKTKSAKLRS